MRSSKTSNFYFMVVGGQLNRCYQPAVVTLNVDWNGRMANNSLSKRS